MLFNNQVILPSATTPASLAVTSRAVSGATIIASISSTGTFLGGRRIIGVLYNNPLSAIVTTTTLFSAYGANFELNRAFNNQIVALLLSDGGAIQFTMLSSATTTSLSTLSAVSQINYGDSWPELNRKFELGYI